MLITNKSRMQIESPFDLDENPVLIIQGWNGSFSHMVFNGCDLRYAVDFALPVGTLIRAGVDGTVKSVSRARDVYEGVDPSIGLGVRSAFVSIAPHCDPRLRIVYSHFDPDSLNIRRGLVITSNMVLGATGRSGWIGPVPHLHTHVSLFSETVPFSINRLGDDFNDESVVNQVPMIALLRAEILKKMAKYIS